mmetsp:Transcript_78721/g.218714  ORF Transcript_78721/g.218714 Transcript_78721/m.218714 type:complete len:234 (-) Transcript_78721:93-794(-)
MVSNACFAAGEPPGPASLGGRFATRRLSAPISPNACAAATRTDASTSERRASISVAWATRACGHRLTATRAARRTDARRPPPDPASKKSAKQSVALMATRHRTAASPTASSPSVASFATAVPTSRTLACPGNAPPTTTDSMARADSARTPGSLSVSAARSPASALSPDSGRVRPRAVAAALRTSATSSRSSNSAIAATCVSAVGPRLAKSNKPDRLAGQSSKPSLKRNSSWLK